MPAPEEPAGSRPASPLPASPLPASPLPASPQPASPQRAPRSGFRIARIALCATVAAGCLAGAVTAGLAARAEATRKPTAAELNAAATTGLEQRWEREAAGTMFPARIGYVTSDLGLAETATRLGISPDTSCAAAVDSTLAALAQRYHCQAGLRASYTDQLQGVVYTVGVLAFPTDAAATAFVAKVPAPVFPATGLRALALAGTPAARFTDAARQASATQLAGPYAVLAVAGYADGRAAAVTGDNRESVFGPVTQLANTEANALQTPVSVDCRASAEWSC